MSDSETLVASIRERLESFPDPESGRPIGSTAQLRDVTVNGDQVDVIVGITTHCQIIADEIADTIRDQVLTVATGKQVNVQTPIHERPPARLGQIGLRAKSVILVGSGKGGVGKSTVAASIALTLSRLGAKVGLMDADVYGPSIPHLLGLEGRPAISEAKKIEPIRLSREGITGQMPVMSMGFLVEPDQAVIWRGPMLHGSITQFLKDTDWGELDYLVIDMPPGTGDVALTLSQNVPITGAVVVCTPQEVALLDAIKAISMFKKVNIPIAGMVENMSGFSCPDCGKTYDIFGRGGARDKAEELGVPYLGGLPIDITLREAGDAGKLAEVVNQDARARDPFEKVVRALVRNLAAKAAAAPPKASLPTL
ncbi:ATP-binding protein involved in chromosome partitioning [Neorhodopirellula lusitana]|uniref:Iron-sulfur cluster carrier protein n=1 Tax=Neorhodopirellula lusitana TaxID=445327 RepID=A0ABY1QGV6_9BACT|nr:Mrp/NBP35 family ATP-binding protein [Neorhodopirellula lusitana]SMP70197.1 ATP-binding protein involved in chromosome partitioning [Neorhodopirellula lusitana]